MTKAIKLKEHFKMGGLRNGSRYHHRNCPYHCMTAIEARVHLETCTSTAEIETNRVDATGQNPTLTLDFYNWIATELVTTRKDLSQATTELGQANQKLYIAEQKLIQTKGALARYQNGVVGAELAQVYNEYGSMKPSRAQ